MQSFDPTSTPDGFLNGDGDGGGLGASNDSIYLWNRSKALRSEGPAVGEGLLGGQRDTHTQTGRTRRLGNSSGANRMTDRWIVEKYLNSQSRRLGQDEDIVPVRFFVSTRIVRYTCVGWLALDSESRLPHNCLVADYPLADDKLKDVCTVCMSAVLLGCWLRTVRAR